MKNLRKVMSDHVGVERDAQGLKTALGRIAEIEATARGVTLSFLNMTSSATLVAARPPSSAPRAGAAFPHRFPRPTTTSTGTRTRK